MTASSPPSLRIVAASLLCLPLLAGAAGFGEITLHSRIGEPLRAEVPIIGQIDGLDTACFALAPLPSSDLPVIHQAQVRLTGTRNNLKLLITSRQTLSEPAFLIALRASCGIELQRDYVLVPMAPLMIDEITPAVASVGTAPGPTSRPRLWQVGDGESLASIAAAIAPGRPAQQKRILAGLQRNHPEFLSQEILPTGMVVQIPERSRNRATAKTATPRPASQIQTRPGVARANPAKLPAPASAPAPTGDRLVIAAPPAELKAGEKAVPASPEVAEIEVRMKKMENTIASLNAELNKLGEALTVSAEALKLQQQLMLAQQTVPPPPTAPITAVETRAAAPAPAPSNWWEFAASALFGGILAAGIAHFFALRHDRRRPADDPPPEFAPIPRPPISAEVENIHIPKPVVVKPSNWVSEAMATRQVDFEIEPEPALPAVSVGTDEFSVDESNSVVELAEIMLSFGRIRGAAETLSSYIETASPTAPQPWLMLLDLYRRSGMREEFEALMPRVAAKFNIHVMAWDDRHTHSPGLLSLEDFNHIAWRLIHEWGTRECLDYLYSLVTEKRDGSRQGFPLEVVEEIVMLIRVLEDGYKLTRSEAA